MNAATEAVAERSAEEHARRADLDTGPGQLRLLPGTARSHREWELDEQARRIGRAGVAAARAQLEGWVEAGVTHILDVRLDQEVGFDVELVAAYAPHVTYLRAGVDDSGRSQDDAWFDAGVDAALEALADPAAKIVVHCHMGVNRGPSMAFAILLAAGWDAVPALEAIRQARPIAAIVYANDAVAWWLRRNGATDAEIGAHARHRTHQQHRVVGIVRPMRGLRIRRR